MALPDKLLIARMENYHTHYLGRNNEGKLFWGYETFVFETSFAEREKTNWEGYRREYAVFHTFDSNGNYLTTKYLFDGTANICGDEKLENYLEECVNELGNVEYCDIEVKLFQTTIDGLIFGLIPNEENESIELQPSSTISFQKPWDGEYYT